MNKAFIILLTLCLPVLADRHIVVIDPGHGGVSNSGSQSSRTLSSSNNAKSPGGLLEKDMTLELCLEIKKQVLSMASEYPGTRIDCVLTRVEDSNPDFAKRALICAGLNVQPSAIFSVHFNASSGHNALGTLAVLHDRKVNKNYEKDQMFAKGLVEATSAGVSQFIESSKARSPISDAHLHNGAGSNFFYQLALHPEIKDVPKCFLEVEFIDREDVEKNLLANRKRAFPVIARSIASYLYTQFK
jgi:N-acetylmuramoyl-L-alanine amidase